MRYWVIIILFIFLVACETNKSPTKIAAEPIIALQPLGTFPESTTAALADSLQKALNCSIILLPARPLPKQAYYKQRQRYRADTLIKLAAIQSNTLSYRTVVYLTVKDVSHSNEQHHDFGIFGLGYQPGNGAVASTFRLRKHINSRLFKVVIHEIGHNAGLPHCTTSNCYMRDAHGKMIQDSLVAFCNACKPKLVHLRK